MGRGGGGAGGQVNHEIVDDILLWKEAAEYAIPWWEGHERWKNITKIGEIRSDQTKSDQVRLPMIPIIHSMYHSVSTNISVSRPTDVRCTFPKRSR